MTATQALWAASAAVITTVWPSQVQARFTTLSAYTSLALAVCIKHLAVCIKHLAVCIKHQHHFTPLHAPPAVDGIAYAWGSGLSGQLGNGTQAPLSSLFFCNMCTPPHRPVLQESRLLPTRMLIEGHRPFKAFAARGGECAPPPPPSDLPYPAC
jgi:hypothetical protein